MSSQRDDDDDTRPVVWAVLIGAIVLAVGLALGIGVSKSFKAAAGASGASGAAGVTVLDLRDDESRVVVEGELVKFYFASGKAELAEGADQALAATLQGVAAGKKAVVSGFHDATGSAALNEELSKQRAIAVRDALVRLGATEDKVELRKPEATQASGSNAEARRVEVRLE
jgi:outer membrane protein OmpA-like peptidoglycan-associated protein